MVEPFANRLAVFPGGEAVNGRAQVLVVVEVTSVGGCIEERQIEGAIDRLISDVGWAESFCAASETVATVLFLLGFREVFGVYISSDLSLS